MCRPLQTYCATRYLGMTVRLLYEEFLELYAILSIPTSYDQQTKSLYMNHPSPKAASAFLLQVCHVMFHYSYALSAAFKLRVWKGFCLTARM